MAYKDFIAEDRRLAELRFLAEENDYALNDSVMQTALELIGHANSREVVRADFAWLQEMGLIEVEIIKEHIHVARLKSRGIDVANGRAMVPGVKKPRPE